VTDDLENRIRRRAYQIWEREGRPEGREEDHWKLASEEIAIEDNHRQALKPNPSGGGDDTAERTEPVEPLLSVETQTEGIAPAGQPGTPQPAPVRRTRTARTDGTAPGADDAGGTAGRRAVAGSRRSGGGRTDKPKD
jgi:hypothetical protein